MSDYPNEQGPCGGWTWEQVVEWAKAKWPEQMPGCFVWCERTQAAWAEHVRGVWTSEFVPRDWEVKSTFEAHVAALAAVAEEKAKLDEYDGSDDGKCAACGGDKSAVRTLSCDPCWNSWRNAGSPSETWICNNKELRKALRAFGVKTGRWKGGVSPVVRPESSGTANAARAAACTPPVPARGRIASDAEVAALNRAWEKWRACAVCGEVASIECCEMHDGDKWRHVRCRPVGVAKPAALADLVAKATKESAAKSSLFDRRSQIAKKLAEGIAQERATADRWKLINEIEARMADETVADKLREDRVARAVREVEKAAQRRLREWPRCAACGKKYKVHGLDEKRIELSGEACGCAELARADIHVPVVWSPAQFRLLTEAGLLGGGK